MSDFFGDAGQGDKSGVWQDTPAEHPAFRAEQKRLAEKRAKKRKAEEMV
jgi:chlorophyllide a reductase subunit Y